MKSPNNYNISSLNLSWMPMRPIKSCKLQKHVQRKAQTQEGLGQIVPSLRNKLHIGVVCLVLLCIIIVDPQSAESCHRTPKVFVMWHRPMCSCTLKIVIDSSVFGCPCFISIFMLYNRNELSRGCFRSKQPLNCKRKWKQRTKKSFIYWFISSGPEKSHPPTYTTIFFITYMLFFQIGHKEYCILHELAFGANLSEKIKESRTLFWFLARQRTQCNGTCDLRMYGTYCTISSYSIHYPTTFRRKYSLLQDECRLIHVQTFKTLK